ncbi:hypothetical protein P3S67_016514 [Capsicum chacoense]
MDNWSGSDKTKVFLKVQNSVKAQYQSPNISQRKQSRSLKVIVASSIAALMGITFSIITWFLLFKKRTLSGMSGDLLDLAPILPGILTPFSYNELKIITQDFSRKLGEGGFGFVYEGTLSNGNKIAVKLLNGVGQVNDSFLTEVKIVGSIHHLNLVKLIGFCAEKDHWVLIYEYMVNGSLDRWISHEKQENRYLILDVYAFGIVLLEVLSGRKNLDWSQADEDDVHLLSVFRRKSEQEQLMDMVDKNNEDMQLHREEVTEMMSLAAWCLQGNFNKRPSMSSVFKVLEGLVSVETNLDFNFTYLTEVGAGNQQREATISPILPSVLSGPSL